MGPFRLLTFIRQENYPRRRISNSTDSAELVSDRAEQLEGVVSALISRTMDNHLKSTKFGNGETFHAQDRRHVQRNRASGITRDIRRHDDPDPVDRALDLTLEHGLRRSALVIDIPLL